MAFTPLKTQTSSSGGFHPLSEFVPASTQAPVDYGAMSKQDQMKALAAQPGVAQIIPNAIAGVTSGLSSLGSDVGNIWKGAFGQGNEYTADQRANEQPLMDAATGVINLGKDFLSTAYAVPSAVVGAVPVVHDLFKGIDSLQNEIADIGSKGMFEPVLKFAGVDLTAEQKKLVEDGARTVVKLYTLKLMQDIKTANDVDATHNALLAKAGSPNATPEDIQAYEDFVKDPPKVPVMGKILAPTVKAAEDTAQGAIAGVEETAGKVADYVKTKGAEIYGQIKDAGNILAPHIRAALPPFPTDLASAIALLRGVKNFSLKGLAPAIVVKVAGDYWNSLKAALDASSTGGSGLFSASSTPEATTFSTMSPTVAAPVNGSMPFTDSSLPSLPSLAQQGTGISPTNDMPVGSNMPFTDSTIAGVNPEHMMHTMMNQPLEGLPQTEPTDLGTIADQNFAPSPAPVTPTSIASPAIDLQNSNSVPMQGINSPTVDLENTNSGLVGDAQPGQVPEQTEMGAAFQKATSFSTATPQEFVKIISPMVKKFPDSLTGYTAKDYAQMDTFLNADKSVGYAVNGGELVSVFNKSGVKGAAMAAVADGIEHGATTLNCLDGPLVSYYSKFGFEIDKIEPNWDVGKPDVVYMKLNPEKYAEFKTANPGIGAGEVFKGGDGADTGGSSGTESGASNPQSSAPEVQKSVTQ